MTELTSVDIEVKRASVQFSRRTARAMNSRLFMSYTIPHPAKIMNTIMALGIFGTFEQLPDIGRYDSEEEAAKAYDKVAIELFGLEAKLNFP